MENKTPFYEQHLAAGGKMVPFAGFLMPVQYTGIIEEHRHIRSKVGLFDVSHMGEIEVWGPEALKFVSYVTVNDPAALAVDQVQYSAMCYPDAGIVDDLLVYRFPDHYFLVVNASNLDKDFAWLQEQSKNFDVTLKNTSPEVAFCYMDLLQRDHPDWAWLFLNLWLEKTGDHAGLALLRYYAVYRALVRAKVAVLRAGQTTGPDHDAALNDARALLQLATTLTRPLPLRLDITHGLSGSGKSTVSQKLMQNPGAIRLRSDVERKRLAGLDALALSGSGIGEQLYATGATRRTYEYLARLTGDMLDAGWPVIVDATFIARWQRDLLREQAQSRGVAFHILDFQAPVAVLRERILKRTRLGNDASDADLAVLQHQLDTEEPLANDEQVFALAQIGLTCC